MNTENFLSPKELKAASPLSIQDEKRLLFFRNTAREILLLKKNQKALLVGPCSVHDEKSLFSFAQKLKILQEKVENNFFLVLRCFVEKSRTANSWKGFVHDPHLNGSADITLGITKTRKMLLELLRLNIPIALEFVDPFIAPYLQDLVTWGIIGARTSSSPIHRQMASLFDFPMGFKNNLLGDLFSAIAGAHIGSIKQKFLTLSDEGKIALVESLGNPYTHIILRGSLERPNYEEKSILAALDALKKVPIPTSLMIDCSHGNSQNNPSKQQDVFGYLINLMKNKNFPLMGLMLESHLFSGKQPLTLPLKFGISVTDGCLGWKETEQLILWANEQLSQDLSSSISLVQN